MNIDVKKCQRCGEDHDAMSFIPLLHPVDDYTYFGTCPSTNQPVLLAIREKVEKAAGME